MKELALVTGASRGVGRAVALALARRGVELLLLGRASEKLSETCALVESAGVRATKLEAELTSAAELERAAALALARRVPTIVVHNAGSVVRASLEDTTLEAWDEQLAVNLRAPFVLTRALLPAMRSAGRGRFVFVGSISSTIGSPGAAAYAASKWGLVGLMKSLASELTDSGLMACAILPGSIDTDMLKGSTFTPRMSAAEVARSIEFLVLDASLAHNGAVLEMFGI